MTDIKDNTDKPTQEVATDSKPTTLNVAPTKETTSVTFKCSQEQKDLLIKKAVDESGMSISDFVKYKVFNDNPVKPTLENEVIQDVLPDAEREALENLVSKQREQIAIINDELYKEKTKNTDLSNSIPKPIDTEKLIADAINDFSKDKLIFVADVEIQTLVSTINENRKLKGLAPLQNSIVELLFFYFRKLNNEDLFRATTGLSFSDDFYENIKALALSERERNNAASNIIESGFFGYDMVDTSDNT
jgi:hypothetical protein